MYKILNNDLHLFDGEIKTKNNLWYVTIDNHSVKNDLSNAELINTNQINNIVIHKTQWSSTYIVSYNNYIEEYNCDSINNYTFDYLIKHNINKITLANLYPNKNVINYINKECKSYCEIGVRYGATASYILNYINQNNLNISIHLFEHNILFFNFLSKKYKNNSNCFVYFGDAAETLKLYNNEKFDVVYFDASHNYNSDKQILNNLIQHLNEQSTIIFDDYELKGVKQLVDEFELKYKNKFNIIKISY